MRLISLAICFCMSICMSTIPGFAEDSASEDYVLTIDGIDHPLALGTETAVKLKSGAEVPVTLKKNQFGRFATGDLSFEYPGQYSVASTVIDDGVTQHIVVTGIGTMILVQSYKGGIPDGLLDVMFDEMVEEPKAMGQNIERTDLTRTISNKAKLTGVRAHYKGNGDDVTIDITLAPAGEDGFMILTMHDTLSAPDEKAIIERFWESVTLKNPPAP